MKEREAETEGSLLQRYLSTDQPVLLGVQGEGLREGRAELHPSEEPQEDLKGDRVELHPSEVPLEDQGVVQVGRVELHPSEAPLEDLVELSEDHWVVDLVALQMHRVEGLMMVDLVLLVDRVVSRPSVVQRVDREG